MGPAVGVGGEAATLWLVRASPARRSVSFHCPPRWFRHSQADSAGPDGESRSPEPDSSYEAGSTGDRLPRRLSAHGPGTCGEGEADTLLDSAGRPIAHGSRSGREAPVHLSWTRLTGGWGAWNTWGDTLTPRRGGLLLHFPK